MALLSALLIAGIARVRFDDQPRGFFRAEDEEFARLEQTFQEFGADDLDVLLVLEGEELFEPVAYRQMRSLVERLREVDDVAWVLGLDQVPERGAFGLAPRARLPQTLPGAEDAAWDRAREEAKRNPLVRGQLLSEDARTALVALRLTLDPPSIREMGRPLAEIRRIATECEDEGPLSITITGIPPIREEIFDELPRESLRLTLWSLLASFLAGSIILRRPGPMFRALLAAGLGALWTVGLLGWLQLPIDLIGTTIPMIVVVIGFTDAMHLELEVRRSRADGDSPRAAVGSTLRRLALACALTSLTTAVGFGSLALAELEAIARFGLGTACGVLATFIAVLLGIAWFGLVRPPKGQRGTRIDAPAWLLGWLDIGLRRPRWTAGLAVLSTGVLVYLGSSLQPDNRISEATPGDRPSMRALRTVDRELGGVLPLFVVVEWSEEHEFASEAVQNIVRSVEDLLEGVDALSQTLSALDIERALGPGALAVTGLMEGPTLLRADLRKTVVQARFSDVGAAVQDRLIRELRVELDAIDRGVEGVDAYFTGTSVVAGNNVNRMIVDLGSGLLLASGVIFLVLLFATKSLRFALVSIVPNLFPLAVVAAWMTTTGRSIDMTSAMVFTVCLGIAVDDTIHVLTRFRHERVDGSGSLEAVRRTLRAVSPALLATTAILIAGFGVLLTSPMPTVQLFGELSCVGFAAAFLGDLVLLPALLVVVDRGPAPPGR